jgi:succinate dehydrogenase / fumarate reductase membrane anchor subunit
MKYRTPISRAKGLGSAKHGSGHWLAERISGAALVPLVIWFVIALLGLVGESFVEVHEWAARPWNAVLLILFVGATAHHAQLGMQVIYEDYIASEGPRIVIHIVTKFLAYVLAAVGIFAVLKIALGG